MKVLRRVLEYHLAELRVEHPETNPTAAWVVHLFYDGDGPSVHAKVLSLGQVSK